MGRREGGREGGREKNYPSYINPRWTTDDILHFPSMDGKGVDQGTRVEVPQFDSEVGPS